MTSESDRQLLLRLARETITAHVTGARAPAPPIDGVLAQPGAAFVTLHAHGDLRGCIGHLDPAEPLGRVIPQCAIGACSRDPRFASVSVDELPAIDIELSLLGPMEPITGRADIEIGPGLNFLGMPYPASSVYDISRARAELGYAPQYDLERGIADYLESLERLKAS